MRFQTNCPEEYTVCKVPLHISPSSLWAELSLGLTQRSTENSAGWGAVGTRSRPRAHCPILGRTPEHAAGGPRPHYVTPYPAMARREFFQRTAFQSTSPRRPEPAPAAREGPALTLLKICRPSWPPDTWILPSKTVTPAALRFELIGVTTVHLRERATAEGGAMRPGVPALPRQLIREVGARRAAPPLAPWTTSPPLPASPTTRQWPSLAAASPPAPDVRRVFSVRLCRRQPRPLTDLLLPCTPGLNGTTGYLVIILAKPAFLWPLLPRAHHSCGHPARDDLPPSHCSSPHPGSGLEPGPSQRPPQVACVQTTPVRTLRSTPRQRLLTAPSKAGGVRVPACGALSTFQLPRLTRAAQPAPRPHGLISEPLFRPAPRLRSGLRLPSGGTSAALPPCR